MKPIDTQSLQRMIIALFQTQTQSLPHITQWTPATIAHYFESEIAYQRALHLLIHFSQSQDPNEVTPHLINLLQQRWNFLKKFPNFSYPHNLANPAHGVYCEIADALTQASNSNQHRYHFLMPSLMVRNDDAIGVDKPLTELQLHEFILSDDGDFPIGIQSTLELSKETGLLRYYRTGELRTLSEQETTRLLTQPAARLCFQLIQLRLTVMQNGGPGHKLQALSEALIAGGVRGAGAEENAGAASSEGIVAFADYFNSLTDQQKNSILTLAAPDVRPFSELWQTLTRSPESNYRDLIHCVNEIGKEIAVILRYNQWIFGIDAINEKLTHAFSSLTLSIEAVGQASSCIPNAAFDETSQFWQELIHSSSEDELSSAMQKHPYSFANHLWQLPDAFVADLCRKVSFKKLLPILITSSGHLLAEKIFVAKLYDVEMILENSELLSPLLLKLLDQNKLDSLIHYLGTQFYSLLILQNYSFRRDFLENAPAVLALEEYITEAQALAWITTLIQAHQCKITKSMSLSAKLITAMLQQISIDVLINLQGDVLDQCMLIGLNIFCSRLLSRVFCDLLSNLSASTLALIFDKYHYHLYQDAFASLKPEDILDCMLQMDKKNIPLYFFSHSPFLLLFANDVSVTGSMLFNSLLRLPAKLRQNVMNHPLHVKSISETLTSAQVLTLINSVPFFDANQVIETGYDYLIQLPLYPEHASLLEDGRLSTTITSQNDLLIFQRDGQKSFEMEADSENGPVFQYPLANNRLFVSGVHSQIWDMNAHRCLESYPTQINCNSLGFATESQLFYVDEYHIRVLDHKTQTEVKWIVNAHNIDISLLTPLFNELFVSGDNSGLIKIWSLYTHHILRVLQGHAGKINAVAELKVDYKHNIVSASDDKTIKIWNLITGECLRTLTGHTDKVIAVAILHDKIVSRSDDLTIKIWETNGTCLQSIKCAHKTKNLLVDTFGTIIFDSTIGHYHQWQQDPCANLLMATLQHPYRIANLSTIFLKKVITAGLSQQYIELAPTTDLSVMLTTLPTIMIKQLLQQPAILNIILSKLSDADIQSCLATNRDDIRAVFLGAHKRFCQIYFSHRDLPKSLNLLTQELIAQIIEYGLFQELLTHINTNLLVWMSNQTPETIHSLLQQPQALQFIVERFNIEGVFNLIDAIPLYSTVSNIPIPKDNSVAFCMLDDRHFAFINNQALSILDVSNDYQLTTTMQLPSSSQLLVRLEQYRIAMNGPDFSILIWDYQTRQILKTLHHTDTVYALYALPQNKLLSLSFDGHAVIWDLNTGVAIRNHHIACKFPRTKCYVALMPNGKILISSPHDLDSIRMIDVDSASISNLSLEDDFLRIPITAMVPCATGELMCAQSQKIKIFDIATGKLLQTFHSPDNVMTQLQITAHQDIVSITKDGRIEIWNKRYAMPRQTILSEHSIVSSLALPSGDFAIHNRNGSIKIYAKLNLHPLFLLLLTELKREKTVLNSEQLNIFVLNDLFHVCLRELPIQQTLSAIREISNTTLSNELFTRAHLAVLLEKGADELALALTIPTLLVTIIDRGLFALLLTQLNDKALGFLKQLPVEDLRTILNSRLERNVVETHFTVDEVKQLVDIAAPSVKRNVFFKNVISTQDDDGEPEAKRLKKV